MERREFMKGIAKSILSASLAPDLLASFLVRNYSAMPLPVDIVKPLFSDYESDIQIRAIGVGPLGAGLTQLLSRNLRGIICHDVIFDLKRKNSEEMANLFSSIRQSDLVFIITGFDDHYCGAITRAIAGTARETGVLTLAITPCSFQLEPTRTELTNVVDTVFSVSEVCLAGELGSIPVKSSALTGYSMRHVVNAVTNLLTHSTGLCIDFADINAIMRRGSIGRLGVGVATGPAKGRIAAMRALERLAAQGLSIYDADGVLVSVHGSSLLTMDEFDEASSAINACISEDANNIAGIIMDEQLGHNVKVTVMTVTRS